MLGNITLLRNHRFAINSQFFGEVSFLNPTQHSHPYFEVFYVISGKAKFSILDKSGQSCTEWLKNGDLVLIERDSLHSFAIDKETQITSVELCAVFSDSDSAPFVDCFEMLCNCDELIKAFDKHSYIFLNDFMYLKQSLTRLQALLNSDRMKYADNYFTQLIIGEILLSINECYKKPYLMNPYINLVLEYITRNFCEDLSVKEIAEAVNLNSSYLQKIFKKHTGSTIFDYIISLRINKSISLMRNSDMTFSAIATETGFNNRQSFFNVFKKYTGYPPKLYKKYLALPQSDFPVKN